jgi:extradiol dioxygenase family protein
MNEFYVSHSIFPSPDIEKTCNFYSEKLGFGCKKYLFGLEPHIIIYKDQVVIVLTDSKGKKVVPNRDLYGYGYDIYVIVKDHESLQQEFKEKGVKVVREVSITDYGNKELVIEDIDGRWVAFGLKIGFSPVGLL